MKYSDKVNKIKNKIKIFKRREKEFGNEMKYNKGNENSYINLNQNLNPEINYNIYDRKKKLNKKHVFLFLFIILLLILLIVSKVFFKQDFKDVKNDERYFKTHVRKIDRGIKKYVFEKKKNLNKKEFLTDEEKNLKQTMIAEKNKNAKNNEINNEKTNEQKTEEQKNKEENQEINKEKITKKEIIVRPDIFTVSNLSFLKYNIWTNQNDLISEEIKIYVFKDKKLLKLEDVFEDRYKNEIYEKIGKSFDDYIKNNESMFYLNKIYPDQKKRLEIIKSIEDKIKDKTLLETKKYFLDESGLSIYLDDKIMYLNDDSINFESNDIKKCTLDRFNFKLFIPNEEIYLFLINEYKEDYLKKFKNYNMKCEAEALRKRKEEEEKEKERKLKAIEDRKKQLEGKKYVALSFDDGPGEYTKYFLDKLKEKNVKTTFFVLGQKVPGREDVLKQMVNDGHDIGNHSYNHANFGLLKKEDALGNIELADVKIKDAIGFVPKYLRPPYGVRNYKAEEASGKTVILWNYDPLDWKLRDVEKVKEEILKMPENALAVMHDIHKTTVDAVIEAIDEKRKDGFEFVTVTELLEKTGN